jgi:hypothetical protein
MLPRQFFFVYPPQHLRSGITFPIIKTLFGYEISKVINIREVPSHMLGNDTILFGMDVSPSNLKNHR